VEWDVEFTDEFEMWWNGLTEDEQEDVNAKVMLDADLAQLYGVPTKVLNQAVARNIDRFPEDFMFQLTEEEATRLRSQTVTLKMGRGQHRKCLPHAFTEQGVAMLSSVLRSRRARGVLSGAEEVDIVGKTPDPSRTLLRFHAGTSNLRSQIATLNTAAPRR
jgi:hypothetical protein